MLIVAGTLTLDPACRASAADAFDRLRQGLLRSSAGCRSFEVYLDRARTDTLFVFQIWESADAFRNHLAIPDVADLTAALAVCGVLDINLEQYHVVDRRRLT